MARAWAAGAAVLLLVAACGQAGASRPDPAAQAPHNSAIFNRANRARYTTAELGTVDTGTAMGGTPAPGFTLTDQFGQHVSLSQFRGKVVVLSFDDDECTTVCPLTTALMVQALGLLGPAAQHVQLLGVNANPEHVAVSDVATFSRQHGMTNHWLFLTGSRAQLTKVWKAYSIDVQIQQGKIDHTPAVYLLDQQGREQRLFLTSTDYGVVPVESETLARAIARLLPGHPAVAGAALPSGAPLASPSATLSLPALAPGGPKVALGGGAPQLAVFFASWAPDASPQLQALKGYASRARGAHLPVPVAVDVEPVEPSLAAARALPAIAGGSLGYPVAVDATGRVADAYGVQDIPWIALTDHGKVVWSHDGWLAPKTLAAAVQKALASH